ncbi:hypothetical protein M5K25_003882 [Dendrobium thyrsiflorum]|uniref:Uncharacterized protein n=1 Tax=Dendrobium thyrsiflorum TaxID=117978 RepID=A0ABD0VSP0_DENTH
MIDRAQSPLLAKCLIYNLICLPKFTPELNSVKTPSVPFKNTKKAGGGRGANFRSPQDVKRGSRSSIEARDLHKIPGRRCELNSQDFRNLNGDSTKCLRIRSYDILIGSNNGSSLATKVAFPLSKASLASSLLFDLAPMRAFPSCRIGSYNILIGSKHRSSFTVKVTFSLTSATSTKSHKFATKRGKQRIYFTVRFTG